jgi:hypothetical protein
VPRRERRDGKRLSLRERRREREARRAPASPTGGNPSLAETLDRVLTRGVAAQAEVVIGVAGIPLVYVGAQALVASVEAARSVIEETEGRPA